MTQKTLIDDAPQIVKPEQLPAIMPPVEPAPNGSALATLREHAMSVPVETMLKALGEFKERRDGFRAWLLSQLQEGLHFGHPPGCEPKWCDASGKPCKEADAAGTLGAKGGWVTLKSWRPKKSLYAAGADFVCELLGVRDELTTDHNGWVQAGSNAGTFVVNCNLISRSTKEVLANGIGLALTSAEHLGANAALKKAGKRAKVAAVLDWLAIRDLFTQDVESGPDKPLVDNPTQRPGAPNAQPRGKRATEAELTGLFSTYKAIKPPDEHTEKTFSAWATSILHRTFVAVRSQSEWSPDEIKKCRQALEDGR